MHPSYPTPVILSNKFSKVTCVIHNGNLLPMFGKYVREIRAQHRLGLREFCLLLQFDPSNWSKVERGLLGAPKSEIVDAICEVLKATKEQRKRLFNLALADRAVGLKNFHNGRYEGFCKTCKCPIFGMIVLSGNAVSPPMIRVACNCELPVTEVDLIYK